MTTAYKEITQPSLIHDLKDARVQAGITCLQAAKTIGLPVETFNDVEAGKIILSLTDIRAYAYAVGAVIEYTVTPKKSSN